MSPEVKSALRILGDISSATALIPAIVGLLRFRFLNNGLRAILILCVVSIVVDFSVKFSTREYPFGPYVVRAFTWAEFPLISFFFIQYAARDFFKKIIMINIFLFVGIEVIDIVFQGFGGEDDLPVTFESVLNISYAMTTFYFIMKDMQYPNINTTPLFWILTAILIYFAGNIFVFATSDYAYSISNDTGRLLWTIHSIIHIGFNILLAIGLWKAKTASR